MSAGYYGIHKGNTGGEIGSLITWLSCMNGRCGAHISTLAVLYLGISPPPDFFVLPRSLPTRRLANHSSRDAENETQAAFQTQKNA